MGKNINFSAQSHPNHNFASHVVKNVKDRI